MNMGGETVEGFVQQSEKQDLGCVSETVIKTPEKLPDMSCTSSETADVVRNSAIDSVESCATEDLMVNKVVESEKKEIWVIDVKCGDVEDFEMEKVCRICHLNSEQPLKLASSRVKTDLIVLGCGCKGELSVAHSHCAEAWFKLKGNRICEICGQTVTNIRGVGNEGFLEEWRERRLNGNLPDSSERSEEEGCWHGQPLCNFLMACLVIAFVVPWFFRINFW